MRTKHLALISIFITFLLLILGGVVHNTESSLACPDWPLCYGKVFPKMEGGILIEHSHRLLASLVGFLSIILVFLTYKRRKQSDKHQEIFHIASFSLFLVIAQGLLGGITVIYRLPTIVSTSHLGLSMIFFGTLIYLHHKLSQLDYKFAALEERAIESFRTSWMPSLRHNILFVTIVIYAQILLGAFMRHSGAGASCGVGWKNTVFCLNIESWALELWPSFVQGQVHMTHRIMAIIVTGLVLFYAIKVIRYFSKRKNLADFSKNLIAISYLALVLIFSQVFLGVLTVATHLGVVPTTAHLAVGALCLAVFWKINLMLKSYEDEFLAVKGHSLFSDFVELTKPKLSALVIVTAFVGMILAPSEISFFKGLVSLFLISMVVMGSCALNCYLERETDALMERTKDRSLPAGRLHPKTALIFGVVLVALSIIFLVFFINVTTGILAALASVLYLLAYTPLKLKSDLALYVGAIPGAIPPLMGWTAVTGSIDFMGVVLFGIVFFWQLPHFLAISLYYAQDYDAASIKVYPNLRGSLATKRNIFIYSILLAIVGLIPAWEGMGKVYFFVALTLGVLFLGYSLYGLAKKQSEGVEKLWARKLFLGSIFYLPLLLGAMIFLKH